jgi:hypothetical protein
MRNAILSALVLLAGLALSPRVLADDSEPQGGRGHRPGGPPGTFNLTVPDHSFDLILGRPEDSSITISVLSYKDAEGYVAWGSKPGAYTGQTAHQHFEKDVPVDLVLKPLQANTRYYYVFRSHSPGTDQFTDSDQYSFQTARPAGNAFTFTMTADAHLDEHTSPEVYLQTLLNIRADKPDFHIDLGNLFMTDKHAQRDEAAKQYLAQRYYLGKIGPCVPIFLAMGTHDGESARYDDGSPDCLAVWSNAIRKKYFPNPLPDGFYSGNSQPHPRSGLLENYYAWTWGDAQFIVLDPFRFSSAKRDDGGWGWSLGQTQYRWLQQTLANSHSKFKLVIIHNLLRGDAASRGGVEFAAFNEWGGKNTDGTDGFASHRPGWEEPVHQLLVRNHVSAVFRAHDNFYARQELDGIPYIMVPQPSFAGNDRIRDLDNYGYKTGTFLGNSGHIKVEVSPDLAKIMYIRSVADSASSFANAKNRDMADASTLR